MIESYSKKRVFCFIFNVVFVAAFVSVMLFGAVYSRETKTIPSGSRNSKRFPTAKPQVLPQYEDRPVPNQTVLLIRSEPAELGVPTEAFPENAQPENNTKRAMKGTHLLDEEELDRPPLPKYEGENGEVMYRVPPKSGVRLPWVADVVLSEKGSEIVFTVIDRKACDCTLFNRSKAFEYLRSKDPSLTGPGTCGEYVPTGPQIVADDKTFGHDKARLSKEVRYVSIHNGIKGTRVSTSFRCKFGDASTVAEIKAYPFHGVTYRCGVPSALSSKRAIEFNLDAPSIDNRPDEKLPLVARKAFDSSSVHSTQERKRHDIAVCSQASSFSMDHIPEWLVFHMQAGVKHFYIYDQSKDERVCAGLKRFIEAGHVTCVASPYTGCDRGKTVRPFKVEKTYPGGPWSRYMVLAPHETIEYIMIMTSCYARFSQFADWMGFWDMDEFALPMQVDSYKQLLKPYAKNDSVYSIGFRPAFYRPPSSCDDKWRHPVSCPETEMYHLGSWCLQFKGPGFQKKQLFKTSHVCAVNYHYMSCLHAKHKASKEVLLDWKDAMLQHFKLPEKYTESAAPPRFCRDYKLDMSAARWVPGVKSGIRALYPELETIAPAKPSCCTGRLR